MHHPHIGRRGASERRDQRLGAGERAAQRIAHPDRDLGRRRLAFLHHVEMVVEGGNLIDLGLRQSHQLGQRRQMRCRNMPIGVLDHMQVLDEQVARSGRPSMSCEISSSARTSTCLPLAKARALPPLPPGRMGRNPSGCGGLFMVACRVLS